MNIYTYDDTEFSEDEVIAAAKESGLDINSYINKVGIKKVGPGKKKPVAVKGATVTGPKSTVSKSVKPSSVSQDNPFGKVKIFDPLNITKNNLKAASNAAAKSVAKKEAAKENAVINKPIYLRKAEEAVELSTAENIAREKAKGRSIYYTPEAKKAKVDIELAKAGYFTENDLNSSEELIPPFIYSGLARHRPFTGFFSIFLI